MRLAAGEVEHYLRLLDPSEKNRSLIDQRRSGDQPAAVDIDDRPGSKTDRHGRTADDDNFLACKRLQTFLQLSCLQLSCRNEDGQAG
jgi:hypothetical protein